MPPIRFPHLALLISAVLVGGCVGGGHDKTIDFSGQSVDPNPYRPQIVAIESLVFRDGPLGKEGRSTLVDLFRNFGRQLELDQPDQLPQIFSREMQQLGSLTRRVRADVPVEETILPEQWMRIRGSLFLDAVWYRWSSRDPVASAEPTPPPPRPSGSPTRVEYNQLSYALRQMETAVSSGERELVPVAGSVSEAAVANWRARLEGIEREMPAEPGREVSTEYREAYRKAVEALSALRVASGGGGTGASRERQRRLDRARDAITAAWDNLAAVAL